jgi:hypothetical protein
MMASVEDPTTPPPPPVVGAGPGAGRRWAVPGSVEAQPQPVPEDAGGSRPATGWGGPTGGPTDGSGQVSPAGRVPAVVLRPMTTADILDGGFAVLKARPARIFAITAGFVIPIQLLAAYLQRDATGGVGLFDQSFGGTSGIDQSATVDPTGQVVAAALLIVVPAIALVCVAAGIGHLISQWLMGRDAPAGEVLGVIGRCWWPLLGSFVLVKLAEMAGILACGIGILFVMPIFVPVAPIVGVERTGPAAALARSWRLIRGQYFRVMGLAVLMGIVSGLIGNALSALPQSLALWVGYDVGWPLLALGSIVSQVVVLPFVAAATVLLYFDLRVRNEGLDLEMTAVDVLDRTT